MKRSDKIAFIRVKLLEGWKDIEIRREIEVPESTYFYWKSLIEQGNYVSLVNKQTPGPKPRFHINETLQSKILDWRTKYGWGPTKIEGHLDVHFNTHIPHNKIHQLLIQEDMNKPIQNPRRTWGKRRWERDHSMSLWQGDWKGIGEWDKPMLTFYDDHSRFVVASMRLKEATMDNTIKVLEHAFSKHGIPEQVLTDRGSQFWNNVGEQLTEFTKTCIENGAEHIKSSKGRPTTTGKVENFHWQYDNESWRFKSHNAYVIHWNNHRPNGAIGYKYPVEVFYTDRKTPINSG